MSAGDPENFKPLYCVHMRLAAGHCPHCTTTFSAPPGDDKLKAQLDAAQQVLAGWWVVLSEAKGMLTDASIPREAVASMLGEAQRNCTALYEIALGDKKQG